MIDLNELKKLAESATPGPWVAKDAPGAGLEIYMDMSSQWDQAKRPWPAFSTANADCKGDLIAYEAWVQFPVEKLKNIQARNAAFIASANPSTILELIALASAAQESAPAELPPLPEPLEIDWPTLNHNALGCGVEDRGIRDRYDAAAYGWQDGMDRAAERVPDALYDADQMREYGQACATAALSRPIVAASSILRDHDFLRKLGAYTDTFPRSGNVALIDLGLPTDAALIDHINNLIAAAPASPQPVAKVLAVVRGELCYKSEEDDQSYGMWCPVTPEYAPPYPNGTKFYPILAASTPTTLTEKKECQ